MADINLGMTNTSRVVDFDGQKYVIRTPGVGTSEMINRKQEMQVYSIIKDLHISDDVKYIDETGLKIAKYIPGTRNCDPLNRFDVMRCIQFLKHNLHEKHLKCGHTFNLKERIYYYRELAGDTSEYEDYKATERKVMKLLDWIDTLDKDWCLTHIDANPDNFLLSAAQDITLLDWEYAAMQDPHVDIAMFAIYSGYDEAQLDTLISFYFEGENVSTQLRMKIYAYVAICGLLWSNWCEYKHKKGQTFGGAYELSQYNYAVEYSKIVLDYLCNIGFENKKTQHIKAIILAAGKGTRLGKLTEKTPKPLLKIHGVEMIKTCIIALENIGIKEIEVITGYKHKCFEWYKEHDEAFKNVTLTYNKNYNKGNNILSLNCAETKNCDVIILDGDQVLDSTLFKSLNFSRSFYCNQTCQHDTESDWTIRSSIDYLNIVFDIDTTMCLKGNQQLKSISFWTKADFTTLRKAIKDEIKCGKISYYWDNVVVKILPRILISTYQLSQQEAIEIDTLEDYQAQQKGDNIL